MKTLERILEGIGLWAGVAALSLGIAVGGVYLGARVLLWLGRP